MKKYTLKTYRKEVLGLQQQEAAKNLGITRQLLSRWENDGGLTSSSIANLLKVYEAVAIIDKEGLLLVTIADHDKNISPPSQEDLINYIKYHNNSGAE